MKEGPESVRRESQRQARRIIPFPLPPLAPSLFLLLSALLLASPFACRQKAVSLTELIRSWPRAEGLTLFHEWAQRWKIEERMVTLNGVTAPSYLLFPGQSLEARITLEEEVMDFTFWLAAVRTRDKEAEGDAGELVVEIERGGEVAEKSRVKTLSGEWRFYRFPLSNSRNKAEKRPEIRLTLTAGGDAGAAKESALVVGAPRLTRPGDSRPNIIIINIDTLRPDHLGCYGSQRPTSPALDALAQESIVFDHCYSHSSWTPPSVASLFTSLYPPQHGSMGKDRLTLAPGNQTLAEILRDAGYFTAAFSASPFIHPDFGFAQGFLLFGFDPSERAENLNRLIEKVQPQQAGAPFFLYLMYFDPHFPYAPPPAYTKMFQNGPDGRPLWEENKVIKIRHLLDLGATLDRETFEYLKSQYDAEIAYTDAELGRLLQSFRRQGLLENTWLIITSDHGEEFQEHGGYGHGNTLYREVLRVVLIIRPPGAAQPGRRVETMVRQVDVMPTVLEWAGVNYVGPMEGESLARLLQEGSGVDRPVFAAIHHLFHEGQRMRTLQTSREKIILTENPDRAEVFRWREDSEEQHNLAREDPQLLEHLTRKLLHWEKALKPGVAGKELIPEPERTRALLKSLGYTGR